MASKSGHSSKRSKLDAAAFASNQLTLLDQERLAEVAEVSNAITTFSPSQLQSRGLALLNLIVESMRTGLGGKTYPFGSESVLILSGSWNWDGIPQWEEALFLHMPFELAIFVDCSPCFLAQQRKRTLLGHVKMRWRELYLVSRRVA